MTLERTAALALAKHGIWGSAPAQEELPWKELDWKNVRNEAGKMSLTPFVDYGKKLAKSAGCPVELDQQAQNSMRQAAIGRVVAASELHGLQQELERMGIANAVIKGMAVASAYPHPELRSGCDIDLYVDEKDENRVYDWAEKQKWKVRRRVKGTHHGEITHPVLGLIELHVSLCNADEALVESAKGKDAVLLHPSHPYVKVENFGAELVTLDHTEHMLFIINHMINHYLHGEAQLRQMTDVNIYLYAYGDQMDMEYLKKTLEQMRYLKFFETVLFIGNRYLGFFHDRELLGDVLETDAEELLEDFCTDTSGKEEILSVYDTYCSRTIPKGAAGILFKLRILGRNVRTVKQLWGKMSLGYMMKLGIQRIKNLFLKSGAGNDSRGGNGAAVKETEGNAAKKRVEMLEKMGMIES